MRRLLGLVVAMLALSVNSAFAVVPEVQVVCASGSSRQVAAALNNEVIRVAQNQDVTLSAPSVTVNSNGGETTVCVTVTLSGTAR